MILLFGHDELLLRSRRWLLESKGFSVRSATEITQAGKTIASGTIELLIVCSTTKSSECESILAIAKVVQPQMKTLFLDSTPCIDSPGENDAVLGEFIQPRAFIMAVQQMTSVRN